MKKIVIPGLLAFVLLANTAISQNSYTPSDAKSMSVTEANKLNGTAQPTINGKPYSQYKAEQEAIKQQRQQQKQAATASASGLVLSSDKGATASQKPVVVQQPAILNSEMLKLPTLNLVQPAVTDPKNNQPAIEVNTKPVEKEKPQVPEQFRLRTDASWGNAAATEMPVRDKVAVPQVKSDPAQPLNTALKQEAYKTPSYNQEAKPVSRTAADLEAAKPAQQEAEKSTKPVIEASKAAVQEVKIAPQEVDRAPKKD